jgi:type IV secretion system protein VirD4
MNARNIEREPARPILFLLDEMAALGHLRMVEQAFGLMAGFGMQLWGIVQDVSQLEKIYSKGWETFVGNSGVLQYLGSRDEKTASYFSKLCGMSTIQKSSWASSFSQTFGGQSATNTSGNSTNTDHIQRALIMPDELMVFRKNQVLLLIENCNPIHGTRVSWLDDPKLRPLGVNLREQKPVPAPRMPLPVAVPPNGAVVEPVLGL